MEKRKLLIGIMFLSAMAYAQEDDDPPGPPGGDARPVVIIDGLQYRVDSRKHTVTVDDENTWDGELIIPEQVTYKDETYTVNGIKVGAFPFCKTLTKVRIPKTVVEIWHYAQWEDCKNPFFACTSLESIEVDEANPSMCSVDGVLFNKDMTRLFCYPAGARNETYIVPDGVTWLAGDAFAYNPYLRSVQMPNSVTYMSFGIFANCKSLKSVRLSENITHIAASTFESCDNLSFLDIPESVKSFEESVFRWTPLNTIIIRGTFPDGLRYDTFYAMDVERTVIYCQPSEIDKFKKVFKGIVLPLDEWVEDDYHAFLKEGKIWNYQEYYNNGWTGERWTKDVSYVIDGTTEIDGKTYYKMYRISEDGRQYYCNLREEDRKVWLSNRDYKNHLLYDFGMSVGDSYMPSYEPFHYQLTAIKPMQFHNDQLLNVLYYDILIQGDPEYPASYFASASIVEGVGCEEGWNIMMLYAAKPTNGIFSGERFLSCYEDGKCIFTADDFNDLLNPNLDEDIAYRPFVEEDKVWKVGSTTGISDGIVKMVEYYYFDGDTIINGKTCKQMMCQRYVSPNHPDYAIIMEYPLLRYIGAWYEDDKKAYFYNSTNKQFEMKYDFSLETNDTLLINNDYHYVIGPKQTGGLNGFKGDYRDIMWIDGEHICTTWLEGVGGIDGPITNVYYGDENHPLFLMSCTVGDEVIYLNDEYEDGATPETAEARKNRFDFTHTIKTQPKAPSRRSEEISLYGEYSNRQLDINLDPLDDAYLVRITDESGEVVYEKSINAGTIVGLSIDISAYAKGHYTVTVENSRESFTGEFNAQPTGIFAITYKKGEIRHDIYNLHGQRLSSLQKGLNIVNGQKIFVK